jgi:hypothetical protein
MPTYIVELSFEYRSSYQVEAATEEEAIEAAQAHDDAQYYGQTIPHDHAQLSVECLDPVVGEREYVDSLDARVFELNGEEIVRD